LANRLATTALLGQGAGASHLRSAIIDYLERIERDDLVGGDAVWAGVSLAELRPPSSLLDVMARHGVTNRLVQPLVTAAVNSGNQRDLLDVLALPPAASATIAVNVLAAGLEGLEAGSSALATALLQYRDRAIASADGGALGELTSRLDLLEAERSHERQQLEAEQTEHARVRDELEAVRRTARSSAAHELQQIRLQSLQVTADILEVARIASVTSENPATPNLFAQMLDAASSEGLTVEHAGGDTIPYDPERQRVIGTSVAIAPGEPVVIVRPTYLMCEEDLTTVIRYGEVRPATS
jgi:hypothetical protein